MSTISVSQSGGNSILTSALLIYTQANQFGSSKEISLLTEHDVTLVKGQPQIQGGRVMSQKSMRAMARQILNKKNSSLQFIPSTILARSESEMVWWIPTTTRTVYFKTSVPGLEDRCGQVQIPSCIFAVTSSGSYVLCFEGSERPTAKTPLFFSPFFNVWDDHGICLGSTKRAKAGDIQGWTNAFFSSAFSHSNYRSSKATLLRDGERKQLWLDLLDKKLEAFPFDCLPPAHLTLDQFIKKIAT